MLQQWNIRSRAHHCAVSGRAFEDGEKHYTAIYFDKDSGEYTRRDVSLDLWQEDSKQHPPFSFWKSIYSKPVGDHRPELTPRKSPMEMLQRLIEEGDPATENARYILALMLERKRQLSPTAEKETEQGKMLFYENKKTGEVFIVRDPELRLDEIADLQEEVATQLGFGGSAVEAAKVAGVELTPEGKVIPAESAEPAVPEEEASPSPAAEVEVTVEVGMDAELIEEDEDEEDFDEEEEDELDEEAVEEDGKV
jgi:hypothetical protein